MRWAPAKFRKGKGEYADVWVNVGDDGKPLKGEADGLVPMRYSIMPGATVYRASSGKISRIGEAQELDEGITTEQNYSNAIDRHRTQSARCMELYVNHGLFCFPAECMSCSEPTMFNPAHVFMDGETGEKLWECPECANEYYLLRIRDPEREGESWVSEVEIIMGYSERGFALAQQNKQTAHRKRGNRALIALAVIFAGMVLIALLAGAGFLFML